MREANSAQWAIRSDNWVTMQERSRRLKVQADKLNKHGEERRRYLASLRAEWQAVPTVAAKLA